MILTPQFKDSVEGIECTKKSIDIQGIEFVLANITKNKRKHGQDPKTLLVSLYNFERK